MESGLSTCKSYDLSGLRDLITACYAILIFNTRDSRISTQDWTGTNTLPETRHSELKRVSFEVTLSAESLNPTNPSLEILPARQPCQ